MVASMVSQRETSLLSMTRRRSPRWTPWARSQLATWLDRADIRNQVIDAIATETAGQIGMTTTEARAYIANIAKTPGGAELFVVSDTQKLRVFVNVPQNYVPSVPPGTKATLTVPEHSGKTYSATVEASAQAVNPTSGTTLMQLIVDRSTVAMQAEVCSLYLVDGDRAGLTLAATNGVDRQHVGVARLAIGQGITGLAAETRAPHASPWPVFWVASVAAFLVSLDSTMLYAAFGALRASDFDVITLGYAPARTAPATPTHLRIVG